MSAELVALASGAMRSAIGQTCAYFALNAAIYLGVWVWGRERFRRRKIQPRQRADLAQFAHEMRNTALSMLVGTTIAVFLLYMARHGQTRLITDVRHANPALLVAGGIAMVVINDTWFYFIHRLLHTRWLFRHVHRVHHRSVDVTPFSAYSFHPLEALLLSLWIVPYVFLVPTYVPVLAAVQSYGFLENLKSHLGYEFYPRWFARVAPFRWLTTSTYHNVHHTRSHGNYALTFRWWDRWLGTEVADYPATFDALPRWDGAVAR